MSDKILKKMQKALTRLDEIQMDLMRGSLSHKTQQYLMKQQAGLEIDMVNFRIAIAAGVIAEKRKKAK